MGNSKIAQLQKGKKKKRDNIHYWKTHLNILQTFPFGIRSVFFFFILHVEQLFTLLQAEEP